MKDLKHQLEGEQESNEALKGNIAHLIDEISDLKNQKEISDKKSYHLFELLKISQEESE
ncbi:hypothetical protein [Halobacillus ihumii]|uniref:hypothetical protein n=1 Tax=Halobacillus ihumii TaxID=2686092 RepID=UPI0013D3AA31|nr:hypothetical protein [Halobacillus ihumii]